ncbi:MAG TPA: hypothetical protein VHV83_12780 [Armatimonadota bacterium]|nr:hypothetical protein [Armatimonadota bacterium]
MQDSSIAMVVETESEVEARIYASLLNDAGLHAQVRVNEDPFLTNIIRQIALPRYQVVVPNSEAVSAEKILAEERRVVNEESPADEEKTPASPGAKKSILIVIGRILIWLILLLPFIACVLIYLINKSR